MAARYSHSIRELGAKSNSRKDKEEEEEDVLLRKHESSRLVSWRPKRPIPDTVEIVPFHLIARVVHLNEAYTILQDRRMKPRPIMDFSAFHPAGLPKDHPCKNLQVLWFCPQENPGAVSKYGNVEFSLDIRWVLHRWKRIYYVENVSYPTLTLYRVLLTNTDYDKLFKNYAKKNADAGPRLLPLSPKHPCNPWMHAGLVHAFRKDCPRYKGEGFNKHGLVLEFLLEVTEEDSVELYRHCFMRSRNHFPNGEGKGWCHRYVRRERDCMSKYSRLQVDWLIDKFNKTLRF